MFRNHGSSLRRRCSWIRHWVHRPRSWRWSDCRMDHPGIPKLLSLFCSRFSDTDRNIGAVIDAECSFSNRWSTIRRIGQEVFSNDSSNDLFCRSSHLSKSHFHDHVDRRWNLDRDHTVYNLYRTSYPFRSSSSQVPGSGQRFRISGGSSRWTVS